MKPYICRMCGDKFTPTGSEHVCEECVKAAEEFLNSPAEGTPEPEEANEYSTIETLGDFTESNPS